MATQFQLLVKQVASREAEIRGQGLLCLLSGKTCIGYVKHQIITVLFKKIINFNTLEVVLYTQPIMFYFNHLNCFHICPPVTR